MYKRQGLILPYLALTLPLSIWTMTAFFKQIPWEMEQAAQVDGATSWEAFRKAVSYTHLDVYKRQA